MLFKRQNGVAGGVAVILALTFSSVVLGQDRDRDRDDRYRDRDRDRDSVKVLDPGTVIPVRINESIDVDKGDNRVYNGVVDREVRNDHDRMVVPQGSRIELIVRISRDNDLILDLESVTVNGQRYAVKSDPKRFEAQRDDSLVGGIIGAINGGQVRGRAVRIPRDTVVTFRLQRPLEIGVADPGVDRDGRHYHEYDRRDANH